MNMNKVLRLSVLCLMLFSIVGCSGSDKRKRPKYNEETETTASNKDVKNSNIPSGGGAMSEESKKQEQQYVNPKAMHSQATEKAKRNMPGYSNQNSEMKEEEKVPDTEDKKENTLHGPDESIFIKNQKISKKESLNQKKYYFQRNITKEQEEAEIKIKMEIEKK